MQGFVSASTRRLLRSRLDQTLYRAWVCPSCRQNQLARLRQRSSGKTFSTSSIRRDVAEKPYYVTTPIFYVNASPHVGHLYSMVLADVFKRWEVLRGERKAYLCTGTDEHGMKVQRAAELQEVAPKVFCDTTAETFKDLAARANISNDYFIRTTDPDHREAVEYFWRQLRQRGYIYEAKHEGWYCVSDETFYPGNMVAKMVDPMTGKTYMGSLETGKAVEWVEEKNYHFRMTALKDKLLNFYTENPTWVVPTSRMTEVVQWVENNLEDLSISRPVSRLSWGIPVPDDPSQTIYVWVDALINYLTKAGYPMWPPGNEHLGGWPADLHVIGKDIVRFHCVYWPALLMALDLPLPKRVLAHAHWLMGHRKMSKSVGNVVNPFFAIDRWGVDCMRYFLIHSGGISNDADYRNDFIVEKYKKGLQTGLGNLLNRVTRPKNWNVREVVREIHDEIPGTPETEGAATTQADLGLRVREKGISDSVMAEVEKQVQSVVRLPAEVDEHMEKLDPGASLKAIMELVFETNAYLHRTEPWGIGTERKQDLSAVIYVAAETLRVAGILLQPFIPEKAGGLLDRLGVDPGRRSLRDSTFGTDKTYGTPLVPLGKGAQSSLFPPIAVED